MKSLRTLFLGLCAAGVVLLAGEAGKTIPATEAKNHIGEVATVTGHVDSLRTLNSGMTLFNLDGSYPAQAMTIVLRPKSGEPGDVNRLQSKNVSVNGKIIEYKGTPEIEITTLDEIKVIGP